MKCCLVYPVPSRAAWTVFYPIPLCLAPVNYQWCSFIFIDWNWTYVCSEIFFWSECIFHVLLPISADLLAHLFLHDPSGWSNIIECSGYYTILYKFRPKIMFQLMSDGPTNGRTNGRTDGQTSWIKRSHLNHNSETERIWCLSGERFIYDYKTQLIPRTMGMSTPAIWCLHPFFQTLISVKLAAC